MWRKIESRTGQPDQTRFVSELQPGDIVRFGGERKGASLTVTILSDDDAHVSASQGHIIIGLGSVDPRTLDVRDHVMPARAQRKVSKETIHVDGLITKRPTMIEWYSH